MINEDREKTADTRERVLRFAPSIVALVAHLPALGAGYVWLDHAHLEHRLAVLEPRAWPALFTQGFAETGFYRPLVALTLSIDTLFHVPWVFHFGNLLWHALASHMLYVVARRLGVAFGAAAAAATLFAAHPATSLVADAIAFRSESMALLGMLVAVWAASRRRPVVVAAATLFGALSKETALVLGPAFVVAHELAATRSVGGTRTRQGDAPSASSFGERLLDRAPVLVGLASGLGVASYLRLSYAPSFRAEPFALGTSEAIGMRLASIARFAKAALVPTRASICDVVPIEGVGARLALAGALVAAGLVWIGVRAFHRARRTGRIPLAVVFLGLGMLPALQIVPVMRWWSIHYAYIPLAFALVVLTDAIASIPSVSANVKFAVTWTLSMGLSVTSILEARRYHDDAALFAPEVDANPACREAQFYLGEAARAQNANLLAIERYEQALQPRPGWLAYVDRSAATQNLGVARRNVGDLAGARRAFEEALAHAPTPATRRALVHDLATVLLESGDAGAAFKLLEPEVQRADTPKETLLVAAAAARRMGFDATAHELTERANRSR